MKKYWQKFLLMDKKDKAAVLFALIIGIAFISITFGRLYEYNRYVALAIPAALWIYLVLTRK
jgi:uncharacterized membrane protein YoaT (DUF817 family)